MKAYFGETVEVSAVFHDRARSENDPCFDWHSLWRVAKDHPQIKFRPDRVTFIDSNHKVEGAYPSESHFIQLADLIAGTIRSCLDGRCEKKEKMRLALKMLPLVERLVSVKKNPNSRYKYAGRCGVSFFPRKTIAAASNDPNDAGRLRSGFYSQRELLIVRKNQMSLFGA